MQKPGKQENVLIVSDSDRDADLLYAVGFFAPDPFLYARLKGREFIIISDLEESRAAKSAKHCEVLSFSEVRRQMKVEESRIDMPEMARWLLKSQRIRRVSVPYQFPHGVASRLEAEGISLKVATGTVFPEREIKSPTEVRRITEALRVTEEGMSAGIALLKKSKPGPKGRLLFRGKELTAERLRAEIDSKIMELGGVASHTIVACGNQACDAHEVGHGPLRANQPIILDVFPRMQKTGYFGDISRTVVRGKASDFVKEVYQTVKDGFELALEKLKPGVDMKGLDREVRDLFDERGFHTGIVKGRRQGFYHSTGHGLGLEIHELPRFGPSGTGKFKAGHVITVEPGLYYYGKGGVRLEDTVVITSKGYRNLTKIEKVLEV